MLKLFLLQITVRVSLDQESYANTQTGLIKHALNHSRLKPGVVNKHLSPFLTPFTHMYIQQPPYPARTILFLHNTGCKSCFVGEPDTVSTITFAVPLALVHGPLSFFKLQLFHFLYIQNHIYFEVVDQSFAQLLFIGTYLCVLTFICSLKLVKGACCMHVFESMFQLLCSFD